MARPSGIKALEDQLRFQGELPPSKAQLKKQLRAEGQLPPTKGQLRKQTQGQDAPASCERTAITAVEYGGLQAAFDHFNAELFDGALTDVMIVYQRHAHSRGHFGANRFAWRGGGSDKGELSLNPDHFVERTDEQICSTLVHEQVHVWQHQYGKPGSRGYHNREWAAKMKSIGLQPSNTGAVRGKETGQNMTHYVVDGPFRDSFAVLAATGWKLNLESAYRPSSHGRGASSKTKFTCPSCGQNAWGKPDLAIACVPCRMQMHSIDQSYDQTQAA